MASANTICPRAGSIGSASESWAATPPDQHPDAITNVSP